MHRHPWRQLDILQPYTAVFGARVATRMDGPGRSVWHCELDRGHSRMTVMDPNKAFATVANDAANDDVAFSLAIYVPDVDGYCRRPVSVAPVPHQPRI